ncbi:MAG: hypothetical protein IJK07_08255 [Bacteroidales bacterium]|nr:hypothetical protein [Bacteroidales bacterium]
MRVGRIGNIPEIKKAIILASGFGTSLHSIARNIPKPMVPVDGRLFLPRREPTLAYPNTTLS